jgi:hypothetical protein
VTAPAWLTRADDADVVLASLPVLFAVAFITNKVMSEPSLEKKGVMLIAAGVVTLGASGLFASACDGDTRGACSHAPSLRF